ncbi:MAG: type II/IV secretion system protein [Deltaproteobacteria bacterium]|nr:type II/IV secretion system protein [Deltaproteobacteria bacterium]
MLNPGGTPFQGSSTILKFEKDLVAEGLVTADQLSIAHISKENLGLDLGSILIKKGFVTETKLLEFLARHTQIPYVSLKEESIDPEIVRQMPLHLARQHKAVPFAEKDGKIRVAMANPFDSFARDDLKDLLKTEIEPCLASLKEIQETIDQHAEGTKVDDEKILTVILPSKSEQESEEETRKMQAMASGPQVVAAVNQLIARSNAEKASDIHIEPGRNQVHVRFRVDGLLRERGQMPKSMHLPVVSRIKILAGLDIAERRVPQDGRVRVLLVGKPLDMRVSTCPTQFGEKVVIRLLSKDTVINIESLGFREKDRKLFSDIISKSHGIFLATGPTGSGKSTTLYAALMRINSSEKNIISIEDPIENEIEGINQVAVHAKAGLTFASVLRSVLRQDPDVIMIGEIRDAETAQIAVRAAITGHMVLSTLHTNTAAGAISRLLDLGVEPFLLSSALKGVLAQRLVRKICPDCRQEVKPDVSKLWEGAKDLKKAFQGKGCKACGYTGYSGRVAIFELAPINDTIRGLMHVRASDDKIVGAFREMGVKSILKDGVEKIESGVTTVEEVLRVTQED